MMNTIFMPQQPVVNNYTQGFAPQAQTYPQTVLPDDSDRVSNIVGYDVNNYVWGNGQIQTNPLSNPNPQAPYYQMQNKKGKSSPLGALILGTLVAGGALIFAKAKGKNINFSSIKNAVVNFFKKTP